MIECDEFRCDLYDRSETFGIRITHLNNNQKAFDQSDEELDAAIDCLENGKAAGLDDIRTEQIFSGRRCVMKVVGSFVCVRRE